MNKVLSILLAAILLLSLCGCGNTKQEESGGFKPALDTEKSADIVVMGNYANFEALEAIFDASMAESGILSASMFGCTIVLVSF